MVVDDRRHRGETVRVAACDSDGCDHFHWKVLDDNPTKKLDCWELADWAIEESLKVLHDGAPADRFAPLRGLFEGVSSDGR